MINYSVLARFGEPSSWIGVLVAGFGVMIPQVLPPDVWTHAAGALLPILGAASFFIPDNRIVAAAATAFTSLEAALPASYRLPTAALTPQPAVAAQPMAGPASTAAGVAVDDPTFTTKAAPAGSGQAGFARLSVLGGLAAAGLALLAIGALSACGETPQQVATQVAEVQTITSAAACTIQAAANSAGAAFQAAGDASGAQAASNLSIISGSQCTNKPVGTPLNSPPPTTATPASPPTS